MKRFALFAALPALLLSALWVIVHYRQQDSAYVLSRYRQTPYFRRAVDAYLHPTPHNKTLVFSKIWFDRTLNSSTGCETTLDGHSSCYHWSDIWGSGAGEHDFSPAQLAALKTLLKKMPLSQRQPAPQNLLLVGFWENGRWTTRIYDKSRLPAAIKLIHTNP